LSGDADSAKLHLFRDQSPVIQQSVLCKKEQLMRRRTMLASLIALGVTTHVSSRTEARRRKKRNRCTSGPCTYDLCLLYVDAQLAHLPGNSANVARKESAKRHCCAGLALDYQGTAYRALVIACVAQFT
jgi:hypothetical protein